MQLCPFNGLLFLCKKQKKTYNSLKNKDFIQTSVQFLLDFQGSRKLPLLMFYLRLRHFAQNNGGYFRNYKFTHKERYVLLKQLKALRLVKNFRVVKHRVMAKSLCLGAKNAFSTFFVNVDSNILRNKKKFNAFLTAVTETWIRNGMDIREKIGTRTWDHREKRFIRKRVKKEGQEFLRQTSAELESTKFSGNTLAFISKSIVQKWRKVSSKTISNHRKSLKEDNIAFYKSMFKMSSSHYQFEVDKSTKLGRACYYSKKYRGYVKFYPSITTSNLKLKNRNKYYDDAVNSQVCIGLYSLLLYSNSISNNVYNYLGYDWNSEAFRFF